MSYQRRNPPKDSIGELIAPSNGYRGKLQKQGKQVRNHMKDNHKLIKDMEHKQREDAEEELSKQNHELYKLEQFKNVSGKALKAARDISRTSSGGEKEFLTKGTSDKRRDERKQESIQRRQELEAELEQLKISNQASQQRKVSVPKADEVLALAPRSEENFIKVNRQSAVKMQPKRDDDEDDDGRHEYYGQVPQYLVQRQAEKHRQEEERRRLAGDPDCPKGMVVMPEEERVRTLDKLHENLSDCLKQFERLPFVIETISMKRRKEELDRQISDLEKAIKIFSKPKVFVAK